MNRNRTVLFECYQHNWTDKHPSLYKWIMQHQFEKIIVPFNVWMLGKMGEYGVIDIKFTYTAVLGDSEGFCTYEFIFESDEDKTLFCLKYL